MRTARVYYDLTDAYEIWTVTIPDDAPEDEEELKKWLEDSDNQFKWEKYDIWDSGFYDQELIEVSKVDPKPLPKMPDWWEKVYQDLYKNNMDLINKFKEEYE
jgi:hypothetical protein